MEKEMNLCFLIGKIVSQIQFDFILNSENISIVKFELELENKSIITIKGYNEIADECYRKLIKGDIVGIFGKLDSRMEIIIEEIETK